MCVYVSCSVVSDSLRPHGPPGDFPDPGIEPESPALQADSLLSEPPAKPPQNQRLQINKVVKVKRKKFHLSLNCCTRKEGLGTLAYSVARATESGQGTASGNPRMAPDPRAASVQNCVLV